MKMQRLPLNMEERREKQQEGEKASAFEYSTILHK